MNSFRQLLSMGNKARKKKRFHVPERRVPYEERRASIVECIKGMQPRAEFPKILTCCKENYSGVNSNANMDLFSDLHEMLDDGILSKRYEKQGSERSKVFYELVEHK